MLSFFLVALLFPPAGTLPPEPARDPRVGERILEKYFQVTEEQRDYLKDASMEVDIVGNLPSMKKSGRLSALRKISRLGEITYRAITFQGDNTIKRDVIVRYMNAEQEAYKRASGLGITRDNYRFKYYGSHGDGFWTLHLFEVTPRRKDPGLFEGWIWIHGGTGLPVREQGRLAKSPSVFLKKVEFIRDYDIRSGYAVPSHLSSVVTTRVIGEAEIEITFRNFRKASEDDEEPRQIASWSDSGH